LVYDILRDRFKSSGLCHKVTKAQSFTKLFYSFFAPGWPGLVPLIPAGRETFKTASKDGWGSE
jgi:hypothetical protein